MHRENIESIRNRKIEMISYRVDNRLREHLDGVMRIEERQDRLIGTIERETRIEGEIQGLPRIRDRYREIERGDHRA